MTLFKCQMYLARTALIGDTFQIELEFRNVGFWGEGKTRVPGEKPLGARTRTNNNNNNNNNNNVFFLSVKCI